MDLKYMEWKLMRIRNKVSVQWRCELIQNLMLHHCNYCGIISIDQTGNN